ncbi:unnamed protein product (macronuclear) [Paramecium tetraurelia]|uniref:Uncharacterized protein n=1 Tax=Paramecium tetraurelia TaxID=5888 RepID=A0EHM9_PARTE|nr:uncharacterized protein GSPATT00027146001 [Paramecium tetraurelia]CAK94820.1 unnamed protein product [Paramecium tetraurelia]|eukprot:XP_001462193.1 hypothetical protein (macronuclear) [Paramecium tetraurelia strain d4-2]
MFQNKDIAIDFQQDFFLTEQVKEFEAQISGRLLTKDVLLKFTNKEIVYIVDGSIIRIDQILDVKEMPQIMKNLEQIKYLKWMGDLGQNLSKIGKWYIIWRGCNIDMGGCYCADGKKQGIWKEILINYNNQVQVYEFGLFNGGLRQGVWKIINQDQVIGGGSYDLQGNKNGQWLELHQQWEKDSREIILQGEYKNGQKIGRWDTVDIGLNQNKVMYDFSIKQISGGGTYNESGLKSGKWLEIHDLWDHYSSVTFHGEYKNGEKYSSWTTVDRENQKIGGGSYQENGIKNGEWIEICAEWRSVCQINFKGLYKNGKKIGFWDTLQYGNTKMYVYFLQNISGGGKYDDNGLKQGKWIELHDEWQHWDREVTFEGEYFQGKKIGKWNTILNGKQNMLIYYFLQENFSGGGQYDQDGLKGGQWVDLCDGWEGNGVNTMQFTYNGEYLKGKKVGRWDIIDKNQKLIGSGSYDENGMKDSKWIEQHEQWKYNLREITYHGEYKNGKKIGYWNTFQKGEKVVGGGLYDLNGIQDGKWVELDDSYDQEESAITYNGEYQNGRKCGKWESVYDQNTVIGGGVYDEVGLKNGYWIELNSEWRTDSKEIIIKGEYNKGKKCGQWETFQLIYGATQKIETKEYDDQGLRI